MRSQSLILSTLLGISQIHHAHATTPEFTPQDMLTAPRPQSPIISPDRSRAVQVVDQWDQKSDSTSRSVYILYLNTTIQPVELYSSPSSETSDLVWTSDDTLVYLNSSTLTQLSIDYHTFSPEAKDKKVLYEFPKGVNPTALKYNDGKLVFSGQVWESDEGFETVGLQDEIYEERGTSAVIYDELFVRHWDTWRVPGKLWTLGALELKTMKLENLLQGAKLAHRMDPIEDFALSGCSIALIVKAPHLNDAMHTRTDIYLMQTRAGSRPQHLTPFRHGAISAVTFSPSGEKLAWVEQSKDKSEADRNVVNVHSFTGDEHDSTSTWTDSIDLSPTQVTFSIDEESVYFIAEHHGRVCLYHLDQPEGSPKRLTSSGAVSSVIALDDHHVLFAKSSMISPTDTFILDTESAKEHQVTDYSSNHIEGRLDDLTPHEFWFKGDEGRDIMGWYIPPLGYKSSHHHAWPMAFLIHGGPEGAWEDAWSTRWNYILWASRGYFVVAINPTGSTSYGQELTDRIQKHWGDRPYKDLLAGYQYILSQFPQIDPERTVALGASYGGYMINWIQGHNAFRFKALVCHDGIFSTTSSTYTTEEIWFGDIDIGSVVSERGIVEKFNPMNFIAEWSTPQLVIHGGKDYRLPDTEGIAQFTALQTRGVPSRFLYFPDENHWVLKASNSMVWHREVFKWMEEWVGVGQKSDEEQKAALVFQA